MPGKYTKATKKKHAPKGEDAIQFRKQHCHQSGKVHFIGVWDTVGALGIPWSLMGLLDSNDEFYDTKMGSNVRTTRHALAIDEQREDFEPTVWQPRPKVDLKQVWFAGVHSDVGGSYGPDKKTGTCVSDIALLWMLDEAAKAGLKLEPHIRENLTDGTLAPLHTSRKHVFRFKEPLHRKLVLDGVPTKIHPSVKVRYETDPDYRPPKLKDLVDRLRWSGIDVGV